MFIAFHINYYYRYIIILILPKKFVRCLLLLSQKCIILILVESCYCITCFYTYLIRENLKSSGIFLSIKHLFIMVLSGMENIFITIIAVVFCGRFFTRFTRYCFCYWYFLLFYV